MADRFVLDNSIVMSWCFEDDNGTLAERALERLQEGIALVPAIWPLEVGNVLLVAERRGRISEADSVRFLAMLAALPIQTEPETSQRAMGQILSLAREYKLSTYDASYLDLAMREGVPIVTLDQRLRCAAKNCRVALLSDHP